MFCASYAHKKHLSESCLFNVLCSRKSLIRLYMFFCAFFLLFMLFMLVKFYCKKKKKSKISLDNLHYNTTDICHFQAPLAEIFMCKAPERRH